MSQDSFPRMENWLEPKMFDLRFLSAPLFSSKILQLFEKELQLTIISVHLFVSGKVYVGKGNFEALNGPECRFITGYKEGFLTRKLVIHKV